eukprot:COSAG05_NODE_602_length_8420_cov_13.540199_5_plen_283_part_00
MLSVGPTGAPVALSPTVTTETRQRILRAVYEHCRLTGAFHADSGKIRLTPKLKSLFFPETVNKRRAASPDPQPMEDSKPASVDGPVAGGEDDGCAEAADESGSPSKKQRLVGGVKYQGKWVVSPRRAGMVLAQKPPPAAAKTRHLAPARLPGTEPADAGAAAGESSATDAKEPGEGADKPSTAAAQAGGDDDDGASAPHASAATGTEAEGGSHGTDKAVPANVAGAVGTAGDAVAAGKKPPAPKKRETKAQVLLARPPRMPLSTPPCPSWPAFSFARRLLTD